MDSRKSEALNIIIMEVNEILKSSVGVKNLIEDYKRISTRRRFNMWAKKVGDFSYKFVSGASEGVYTDVGVCSSKNRMMISVVRQQ